MAEENKKPIMSASCPMCGQQMKFYVPNTAGVLKITCTNPDCGKPFGVKITEQQIKLSTSGTPNPAPKKEEKVSHPVTDPSLPSGNSTTGLAWLVQKKKYFFNKDKQYRLEVGINTIGMFDPEDPSDIMIEGDRTISHRSISITVEKNAKGYKYLLTVHKAKNPVYLQKKEIAVGTSVYIEPGTEFVLGTTHFIIKN